MGLITSSIVPDKWGIPTLANFEDACREHDTVTTINAKDFCDDEFKKNLIVSLAKKPSTDSYSKFKAMYGIVA